MRKIIVNLDSETERYQHFLKYNIIAERLSPVPLDDKELLLSKPLPARYMEAVNTNFWELL